MSPIPPPPLRPPRETPVLKYKIKYDLENHKVAIEIFYHDIVKKIEAGKMSVLKLVKSRKIEGDPKDLEFLMGLLRFGNPIIVIDQEKGNFSLKSEREEGSE